MLHLSVRKPLAFLASVVLASTLPVSASPLTELHDLVGSWSCSYRAGTMSMGYHATYALDRDGHIVRETASFGASGGDEELIAYDDQHHRWTAVVLDDQGNATVMHATGTDPKHIVYRSVSPDTGIAVTYDRVSPAKYTLHATLRMGGKTMTSVDTCSRVAR